MSKAAFDGAARQVLPGLRQFARGLARDATKGEDIAQDALVNAWAARHSFRPGTNFKAWLFRIARNGFLSDVRRSRPSLELTPDLERRVLAQPATQEETLLGRDFEKALTSLSQPQADAFLMVTLESLTYEEAALRLDVGVGAVKSRVLRARAGILAYLASGIAIQDDEEREVSIVGRRPSASPLQSTGKNGPRYLAWKASGNRIIG